MRTFCKTALTVAALALLAGPALAQRQGQGRGGFGGGFGGFGQGPGAATLLANKSVQEELKLTAEEAAKVSAPGKALQEKRRSMFADLQGATQEQRQEKMKELTDAAKSADEDAAKLAKDTLRTDQLKRFGEIGLQVKGDAAFVDENVQKTLAITDPEKEEIKKIRDDAATKIRELQPARGQGGQGRAQGNRQETQTKIQALRKETLEKVVAVLTDSQKAQWKEMVGSPFEYKPDQIMRGQ
jgi:DNA polymerase III gamma/tau subunit